MIDNWASENLPIYTLTAYTITTVNGTGSYTVGLGGTVNSARPIAIDKQGATYTKSGTTTPIQVVSMVEWRNLESLATGTGSTGVSNTIWYDPQYPLGVVNVMPVPTTADTISFNAWVAASTIANLTTSATYETGAILALKKNLAIALKPYFLDTQIPPEVAMSAMESKNALRYTNITSRAMMRRHQMGREPQRVPGGS